MFLPDLPRLIRLVQLHVPEAAEASSMGGTICGDSLRGDFVDEPRRTKRLHCSPPHLRNPLSPFCGSIYEFRCLLSQPGSTENESDYRLLYDWALRSLSQEAKKHMLCK